MWWRRVLGLVMALAVGALFMRAGAGREPVREPPRGGGPATPLILAPRHRQVAPRPELYLVTLQRAMPMLLEIQRAGRRSRHPLFPGTHLWPRQEPDLVPGEIVTLVLRSDTGMDRTEIWLAALRRPAFWERGGHAAAERLLHSGFPGPALLCDAVAGRVNVPARIRAGLPPCMRLQAADAWISTEEAEER